jgi:protein gp37
MTVQFHARSGGRGIEWCDETRNATGGCLHDCKWEMPDGTVAGCYAKELAESGVAKAGYPHGFEHHYWRPSALKGLVAGRDPLLIFCDSMSDMFAPNVPAEHVHAILDAMKKAPHHSYQSLTKAAPQLLKYADRMPPNLWVGVSSPPDFFVGKRLSRSQQEAMLRKSLDVLRELKAKTGNLVWMSAEPVSWDLTTVLDEDHPLDWIVIGAASNGRQYFQPDPGHIGKLLKVLDATRTPVFYKGNIKPMFRGHDYHDEGLNRWREDFPVAYHDGTDIPAVAHRQRRCEQHGWTKIALEMA